MRGIRVLVVDDNDTFLRSATLALNSLRRVATVSTVTTGMDALAAVQNQAADLVLLDYNMPQMTGVEVAARLRAMGYVGKIVLMSLSDEQTVWGGRPRTAVDAFVEKQHFIDGIAAVIARFFPRKSASECHA